MKGLDSLLFWIIIAISCIVGIVVVDENFNNYSDIITFLSIMIGFQITSLSILFNSPLKKHLYDIKSSRYKTELHRLKDYYRHALYFEVIAIVIIFVMPLCIPVDLPFAQFFIKKYITVLPIILGTVYCFYKICKDLFRIFTFPTNE
jgi:amino acid permease